MTKRCDCGGRMIFDDERGIATCDSCLSYERYTPPKVAAMIEEAIKVGIEATAKSLLADPRLWSSRELLIAERSAREAIAVLRRLEAGK